MNVEHLRGLPARRPPRSPLGVPALGVLALAAVALVGIGPLTACGGDEPGPSARPPRASTTTVDRATFLLNRDRDRIRVDGRAGVAFTNLRGELPWITEVRCGERTRRALAQLPGSEVAFPNALPYAGELEFGLGFRQPAEDGPTFRLAIAARDASGTITPLWQTSLAPPASEEERVWRTERLDVSELPAGDLVFRVDVEPGTQPTPALPVWGDPTLRGAGREITPEAQPEGTRNVVVFLVDTLRADRVGAYGYGRPTTPRLDALAEEGLLFEQALAASSWTKASVASLFTSRLPSHHGAEDFPHRLRESETTIAQLFERAGYATAAFGANLWIFYPHFHFDPGFADFVQTYEAEGVGGPSADRVVDEALDWLEEHYTEPFFLYVHVMDPHTPYRPPGGPGEFLDAPYTGSITGEIQGPGAFSERTPDQLSAEDQRYLDALYDAEIAYADAQMGRLVDALEALGVRDATTFVFVSDHGEEFGDHGGWEHSTTLYEEQIHVPLVVVPPADAGIEAARVKEPVSLIDVAPTLLALSGVPAGDSPFARRGRGLLDASRADEPVLSELHLQDARLVAARLGDTKLIANAEPDFGEEWYALGSDPRETRRLADAPDEARGEALRARASELLARAGDNGLYLELWGGGEVSGVGGKLTSDRPMRDVNPRETEYRIEGENFVGDQAFFADAEQREIWFELLVGEGDERDYITWRAPKGARLTLETVFRGERPAVVIGPGTAGDAGSQAENPAPIEIVVAEERLMTGELPPPPPAGHGPLLRLFRLKRDRAQLDAEQLERIRALGYGADDPAASDE